MSRRRRASRTRRFGDVLVTVARRNGPEGVGSRVIDGENVYELPHWPARFANVEQQEGGALAVEFSDGSKRVLDPRYDAVLTEGAAEVADLSEADLGRLRYLVRSFGHWIPTASIEEARAALPEGAPNANALSDWLKEQWTAASRWPAVPDRHMSRESQAEASTPERFTSGLPAVTSEYLAEMVAAVEAATGILPTDVLFEMLLGAEEQMSEVSAEMRSKHATVRRPNGKEMFPIWDAHSAKSALKLINHSDLTPAEKAKVRRKAAQHVKVSEAMPANLDETFQAIYEADRALSAANIEQTVAEIHTALRDRNDGAYAGLMERWLALHGDAGQVREDASSIERALDRAASMTADPDPRPRVRSEVERRVMEAQRGVYEPTDRPQLQIAESRVRTVTAPDIWDEEFLSSETRKPDPLGAGAGPAARAVTLREAHTEVSEDQIDVAMLATMQRPIEDLREQAMDLYAATGAATAEGRRRISNAGSAELAQIIGQLREDSEPDPAAMQTDGHTRAGRLSIAANAAATPRPVTPNPGTRDTSDDEDLDRLIAIGAQSWQRFEASYRAAFDDTTNPKPRDPDSPNTDAPNPYSGMRVTEAGLAAARAHLRETSGPKA